MLTSVNLLRLAPNRNKLNRAFFIRCSLKWNTTCKNRNIDKICRNISKLCIYENFIDTLLLLPKTRNFPSKKSIYLKNIAQQFYIVHRHCCFPKNIFIHFAFISTNICFLVSFFSRLIEKTKSLSFRCSAPTI